MAGQKAWTNDRITYSSLLAYERDQISAWRQECAEAKCQLTSADAQLAAAVDLNNSSSQR